MSAEGRKAFFAYATERERIRLRRLQGKPWPWTKDPVLQQYRFCNIFREDDVVTQWIKRHIRDPLDQESCTTRLVFGMLVTRFINRVSSLELIKQPLVEGIDDWRWLKKEMRARLTGVRPLVTGAYMVKTPAGMNKLDGLLDIFDHAYGLCDDIWMENTRHSLELTHHMLCKIPFVGSFIAYEIVTDLRHTWFHREAKDIDTWAALGPGAARGIGRVFELGVKHFSYSSPSHQAEMLGLMHDLLTQSRLERYWQFDRRWEMREVEHTLCEFDKYERARLGEGTPKQKYTYNGG